MSPYEGDPGLMTKIHAEIQMPNTRSWREASAELKDHMVVQNLLETMEEELLKKLKTCPVSVNFGQELNSDGTPKEYRYSTNLIVMTEEELEAYTHRAITWAKRDLQLMDKLVRYNGVMN